MKVVSATTSIPRFTACSKKRNMNSVFRTFGYLKKHNNPYIVVDLRDPICVGGKDTLLMDYVELFKETYPDAAEEIDSKIPKPLIDELEITFVDLDHAHDKVTWRSITEILVLVGRNTVYFMSKYQGTIATSAYGAELYAMRTALKKVQVFRYILCCLGVKVNYTSLIWGDDNGVIQNSSLPESLLKKKHVAIAYHKTREAAAEGTVHPIGTWVEHNFADILTKVVTGKTFWDLYGKLTQSSSMDQEE